jgi:predicted transcriptional regulator
MRQDYPFEKAKLSTFFWLPAGYNVKSFNKHAALDLIRFTSVGLSRTDLAEQMGLTRAAVSLIVNDLLETEVIREADSRSAPSGRPPIILEINPNRGLVGSIDMGAIHLSIALADFTARLHRDAEYPFDIKEGPKSCILQADKYLRQMLADFHLSISDLSAIGVGVPGPVD